MVPAVLRILVLAAACAACGRVGFDPTGDARGDSVVPPVDAPTAFGCGLRSLGVGAASSCAIGASGGLTCWGEIVGSASPVAVPLEGPASRVVLGHDHACVLLETGKLRCFGVNENGQLGNNTTESSSTPIAPVGDTTYVDVATWRAATCAVTAAGALECWGEAAGGVSASNEMAPYPVVIPGATGFVRVDVTHGAACADTADQRRFCWGHRPLDAGSEAPTPIEVPYTGTVSLGRTLACLLEAGRVRCIGSTEGGGLGDGRIEATDYVGTQILANVVAVEGGSRVQCAIQEDGALWCWGQNRSGEVGTGGLSVEPAPVRVTVPPAARVALGYGHTCAETTDGVYCWGGNRRGQLGRGMDGIVLAPTTIPGSPPGIAEVRTSGKSFGCARTVAGAVWCWGQNFTGTTGDPSRRSSATATQIALPFAASQISVASSFACARSATQVACWGSNQYGGLGQATQSDVQAMPLIVPGVPSVALSSLTGGEHGVCVLAAGTPYCWGTDKTMGTSPPTALALSSISSATYRPYDFAAGHQCVLDTSGVVSCWGSNEFGELGRGSIGAPNLTVMPIASARTYTHVVTTQGYAAKTCAIPTGGLAEVDCWGDFAGASVPVPTARTLSAVPVDLVAGGETLCARFADGTRECLGNGLEGQFGDGMQTESSTFRLVTQTATALDLAKDNACFVDAGVVRCVGDSRHGALGGAPAGATPMRVNLSCQ